MTFSQRHGYTPAQKAIQLNSMDVDLRNSLWNVLRKFYLQLTGDLRKQVDPSAIVSLKDLWANYFKWRIDEFEGDLVAQLL